MPAQGTDLVLIERSGVLHKATAAEIAALAGGGDDTNPVSPQSYIDDFVSQSLETGESGFLSWSFTTGSLTGVNAEQNHPGIIRRTSGTTANGVASFYLGSAVGTTLFRFDGFNEITWIFRLPVALTDATISFGIQSAMGTLTPTHGVYLQSLPADTNWFFVSRNNSVETRTNSGVARNTSWVKIRLRRVSATEVRFSINGGAEVAITTNIPDAADTMAVGAQITQTATTARSVDIDFFSMKLLGVVR